MNKLMYFLFVAGSGVTLWIVYLLLTYLEGCDAGEREAYVIGMAVGIMTTVGWPRRKR